MLQLLNRFRDRTVVLNRLAGQRVRHDAAPFCLHPHYVTCSTCVPIVDEELTKPLMGVA